MKKVGIIIANPPTNYGAHLQGFATQHVLDGLGLETVVINAASIKDKKYYIDFGWPVWMLEKLSRRLLKKKKTVSGDDVFKKNLKARTEIARVFRSRRLHDVREYRRYDELVRDAGTYNAVMIGSDQMWTPGASFGLINSLRFAPQGVSRVSYATSLGVSEYPWYCWSSARDMWRKMDYISVREEQGAGIIRKVCHDQVDVQVVADPTYLMTKEQWEQVIPVKRMCEKRYVFCYFLGDDIHAKMCAKRFAEKMNLHLVSIMSCESFSEMDRSFADEAVGAISPEDFINWIRGAEYVFTDSFHGLAFSVIHHTQFYVFYRKRKDSAHSRNSRIDNILSLWDCEDRLIRNPDLDWNEREDAEIDFDHVASLVSEKRKESIDFLKRALEL